jgi:hypothetical protein
MRFTPLVARLLVLVLASLSFTTAVASQGEIDSPEGGSCTAALGVGAEGDACISVVHASPDAPNVDIYLDGEQVLGDLGFGWWSDWLTIPAGEHQVQVTAAGAALDTAVIDATVTVEAGMGYQIAATGHLADITPQIYPIDFSTLEDGNARINVVHAVPDAPAVDVAVTGGDVLVGELSFPNASDFLDVPAGTYDLEVRVAGTEDVALPLPGVEIEAGSLYNVYAIGTLETGLYPFVIATPLVSAEAGSTPVMEMAACTAALGIGAGGDACINVVHASPDAPAVDVYLDGEIALEGLAFGEFSGWVAVPAGDHQVQVTPAGAAADDAVIDADVTLDAGMAYHVAATGTVAEIAPAIYPVDLSAPADGNARVRVIHTSPDAPAVDIAVAGGDVLVAGLAFPDASDALEVPAGTYDLEVRPAGTTDVALDLSGVALEAGMVYDVFAIGLVEDGSLSVLVVPSPSGAMAMSAS